MSRNTKRTNIPSQKREEDNHIPETKPTTPQRDNSNPFGISFVVPKEMVILPSRGKYYSDSSPMRGLESVEVKSMTAAEEDILINDNFIRQGVVFDKLIDSILITPNISSRDMLDCDKIAILMSARKTGYGDEMHFDSTCDHCGKETSLNISLTKLQEDIENNPQNPQTTDEWEYLESSGLFSFTLPTTNLQVSIKLMTPVDARNFEAAKKQKEKLNLPFSETVEFIRAVLVEASGIVDATNLNKLAEVLPAADARKIRLVHNKNIPTINNRQTVVCEHCSAVSEKEVPFSLGWFWPE